MIQSRQLKSRKGVQEIFQLAKSRSPVTERHSRGIKADFEPWLHGGDISICILAEANKTDAMVDFLSGFVVMSNIENYVFLSSVQQSEKKE